MSEIQQLLTESPSLLLAIISSTVLSYYIGYLGWSIFLALYLVPLFATTIKTVFQRNVRNRVIEFEAKQLESKERSQETVEWLNGLVSKIWINYNLFAAEQIVHSVEPALKQKKPGGVTDIKFEEFDLGDYPPEFSDFLVHKTDDPNELIFDANLFWHSNLVIKVGVQFEIWASVRISDLSLSSRARIHANLIPQPPFASVVRIQLLQEPEISIDVQPLSSGVDIMALPGFSQMIHYQVTRTVKDMLVAPKFVEIKLDSETQPETEKKKIKPTFTPKTGDGCIGGMAATVGSSFRSVGGFVSNLGRKI